MGKGRIYQLRLEQGFALPVVLVTSVVMLIVLLASLTATSSISAGLKSQYINQLSDEAAQSGMAMAKACMEGNKGAVTWANAEPLMPNTDCKGNETTSCPATSANTACYVLKSNNFRTTFKVGVTTDSNDDAISVDSHGIVREVRKTSGEVANESSKVVKLKLKGPSLTWRQISVGTGHTCAIASDDKAYCWGSNSKGQLGDGTTTQRNAPVAVSRGEMPSSATIRTIGVGDTHTCAIASDNNIYCWGANGGGAWSGSYGKLGTNSSSTALQASTPVAVYKGSGALASKTVQQISVGSNHTCAIASDDKAYCWGDNGYVQLGDGTSTTRAIPTPVKSDGLLANKVIRQISAGYFNTCVVASDNKAYCWGYGSTGMNGNGATDDAYQAVAVSPGLMPVNVTIRTISVAGYRHACVIGSNNKAYCWGNNSYGQLGDNTTVTPRTTPTTVLGNAVANTAVRSVTVGNGTTCDIGYDNNAYCWGNNSYGQLGNGTSGGASSLPVATQTGALAGKTVRSISSGGNTTCVIASDNNAYCWGYNGYGQLGNGTSGGTSSVPVSVTPARASGSDLLTTNDLAVGGSHACAVASDSKAYCWGGAVDEYCDYDPETGDYIPCNYPVLGNGTSDASSTPVPVLPIAEGKTILSLSSSGDQTCVLASDYLAYCWGQGVASASYEYSTLPVEKGAGLMLRAVSAGQLHTCAIAYNNMAYCWGANGGSYGKLGNNSTASTWVSSYVAVSHVNMPAGLMIRQISAGGNHTCVIASDNNAYCWGYNGYVQLGDGTTVSRTAPWPVKNDGVLLGKTIRQISAGYYNTCVIASDSKAYCWGTNGSGQDGNGTTVTPVGYVPVAVSGGYTFSSISVGLAFACGVTTDSKAYCWGSNSSGQLGDGTRDSSSVPVAVSQGAIPSGVTIRSIKAGNSSTCAIASNNKTYCWGSGQFGQLGSGNNAGSLRPSLVKPFPAEKSFSSPGYIY